MLLPKRAAGGVIAVYVHDFEWTSEGEQKDFFEYVRRRGFRYRVRHI